MNIENAKALINKACLRVSKNFNLSASLLNIEFYGVHKYSRLDVYKLTIDSNKAAVVFYAEEDAFESWADVPWSGNRRFRPDDFDNWPADKKLELAWCWALYNYCTHGSYSCPPEIE